MSVIIFEERGDRKTVDLEHLSPTRGSRTVNVEGQGIGWHHVVDVSTYHSSGFHFIKTYAVVHSHEHMSLILRRHRTCGYCKAVVMVVNAEWTPPTAPWLLDARRLVPTTACLRPPSYFAVDYVRTHPWWHARWSGRVQMV